VAGSIGPKWTNLEVAIDVAVVGRRHVEVFPERRRNLSIRHGHDPLRPKEPDHVSNSVLGGQSAAVSEAWLERGARQRHEVGLGALCSFAADNIPASETSAIREGAKRTSIVSALLGWSHACGSAPVSPRGWLRRERGNSDHPRAESSGWLPQLRSFSVESHRRAGRRRTSTTLLENSRDPH